ncbi:DUF3102 domain-containing protein [Clostridium perfringens]|uniref:DUF3102 domain-containing protein n=1 Tax=Clostridium perfringens TaxID=1502 RepID=UPI0018E47817|nr:DUF3102 domain-containing protein [Clostridium perfringens]MBI6052333.1 DUF3102 domain-containing protein [Clostridium perfringens]
MSEITRTPGQIALEINTIKEQTRKLLIYNSIEIGRRLVEAKEIVDHGEWGKWLENEVSYSKSTANNLMKIFKEYGADQINLIGDNLKSQTFGDLSYSQAIVLLGIAPEEREEFVKENNINEMSTRELKKVIDEKKKLEKELKNKDKAISELEKAFNSNVEEKNKNEKDKQELNEKLEELMRELEEVKSRPTEIKVETSDIEEKYRKEIENLNKEKEDLNKRLSANISDEAVYKVHFNNIVSSFNGILQSISNIQNKDEIQGMKYKEATEKFLRTMLERL